LPGEEWVAVLDQIRAASEKPVDDVREVPRDLSHPRSVRLVDDTGDMNAPGLQIDDEQHRVPHEATNRQRLDGEEVGRSDGSPMGSEKARPRIPLAALRRRLDALVVENALDGASPQLVAEVVQSAAGPC
jgi:hypothetical protein